MVVARAAGWVIALASGIGVGLSSYAVSNETRAPERTVALGVSPTAIASGKLALASFAGRRARDPRAGVNARELRWARQAYRSEPLNASAVALQALAMTGKAEAERRWALLGLAGKLTRRSSLVNLALIEAAARRGDQQSFFAWLSRAMLTGDGVVQTYGAAMADATARDGAVEALTRVLGGKPRWANTYWRLVIGRSASLVNAAKIRIALTKKPWNQMQVEPTDGELVLGLTAIGKFEEALELANALRPTRATNGNLLVNGSFAATPGLAPFDWQLSMLGNLGASINRNDRQLVISAVGGASGAAARQLLRLAPGSSYRLGWSMASNAPLPDRALSFQIHCAEKDLPSAIRISIPLVAGKRYVDFKMADGECRWHWASIDVGLPDDAMGVDATLSGLSLSPLL